MPASGSTSFFECVPRQLRGLFAVAVVVVVVVVVVVTKLLTRPTFWICVTHQVFQKKLLSNRKETSKVQKKDEKSTSKFEEKK